MVDKAKSGKTSSAKSAERPAGPSFTSSREGVDPRLVQGRAVVVLPELGQALRQHIVDAFSRHAHQVHVTGDATLGDQ